MGRTFKEVSEKAIQIKKEYSKIEPKEWEVEQVFMGFVKDVGDLSKLLMAEGGYRLIKGDNRNMISHELADVPFSVCVLADKLDIDLEKAFFKTMNDLEKQIKKNEN